MIGAHSLASTASIGLLQSFIKVKAVWKYQKVLINIELVTNTVKNTLFVTNQWFLCGTDSVQQTIYKEMAQNAKIRLGYL